MRLKTALSAAAISSILTASIIGLTAPASAATVTHNAKAQADWKTGATVAAANEARYWTAARNQLAAYGNRYDHERADLNSLADIPPTSTTADERSTAKSLTRELNGFFQTPGLYGVSIGDPRSIARRDWVKSAQVSAAAGNQWLAAARDELGAAGKKFASERSELASLESIPLTNTTAGQRATAHRDVIDLDKFFHTAGLNA